MPSAQTLLSPLLLLLSVVSFGVSAGKPLNEGSEAPDWMLANSQGEAVSFYQHSGDQPSVILFWATWCPYCAELMPELEKLRQELADLPVNFYALNIWEDGDPVQYMVKHDYNFTLLLDADKVAKRYKVSGTPGLFVVDGTKSIRYVRPKGASPEQVAEQVKTLLTELQNKK